ncbi:AmpG family muropeptide MFS transporter [Alkalisalibacterium limincola]|uniref:AmpG family muropeptide MFS transporter n=1 Tax=Alkalisalibacterium limincola TaxID=2699169 RepID=A0A5C8KLV5_9GAMM|nr:AmpG family muropeptide MFS transporter [Alkalisalibacterium limincola]TXK60799.1 AmpG family muropeptide MFS transporter [Alkalisalibacterium limincola]
MTEPAAAPATTRWGRALATYGRPRIAAMFALGFSAGLPFLLVFTTLTAWLTEAGVARSAIGFFSWVGITYSIKVFWSPIVDKVRLPILGRLLGQRRSWILLAQALIILGLAGMAFTDPAQDLVRMALFALVVAFGSATQDIAIDAWRIEAAPVEEQAAMSATYVFGYRIALLVASAGALHLAVRMAWEDVYLLMALLMGIGVVATLLSAEPSVKRSSDAAFLEQRAQDFLARNAHLPRPVRMSIAWLIGAVVCPFVDFFQRYGLHSLVVLMLVASYRISDISMGAMANPFYLQLGFDKAQIANIAGIFGVAMTILGGLLGGLLVVRYGLLKVLLLGAVLSAGTNLLFSVMALVGPEPWMLVITISGDNFCGGLAMAVFIAWLSSLTSTAYTATQYALFSSLMTLPGKFLGGFSGMVVDSIGYFQYFIYVAAIGVPAVVLCVYLMLRERRAERAAH